MPIPLSNIAQHKHAIKAQPIDFDKLRPYFGWVKKDTIEKTADVAYTDMPNHEQTN